MRAAACRIEELLNIVRFFTWNFPAFARPDQTEDLKRRLDPKQIHQNVRHGASELVSSFSSLGTNYFVADPLGLMQVEAGNGQGFSQFANFDLNWGSGNRFFSKDHKALLVIAEPRQSAMDYNFAEQVMRWTREHIQSITAETDCGTPECGPLRRGLMFSRSRSTNSSKQIFAESR